MLWSSLYLVLRQLLQLVVLLGRSQRSKELEILLLHHELAILRPQKPRPRLLDGDRVLLAALSWALPRELRPLFLVRPATRGADTGVRSRAAGRTRTVRPAGRRSRLTCAS